MVYLRVGLIGVELAVGDAGDRRCADAGRRRVGSTRPSAPRPWRPRTTTVSLRPCSLAFDHPQGQGTTFRLVGRLQTTLELACSRCLEPFAVPGGRARSTCATCPPPRAPARRRDRNRRRRPRRPRSTTTTRSTSAQLMREQFYLALPMKPLCREDVPGPVPGLRHEPEHAARATCDVAPGKTRGCRGAEERSDEKDNDDAESKTTTLQDPDGQAPDARRAEAGRPERVPAVPRAEGAAPGLPELRLLRGRQVRAVDEE